MKVIVTGADADIREVLGPKLLEGEYQRAGLDTGLNRCGWLFNVQRTQPMTLMLARQCSNLGPRRSKRVEPLSKSVVRAPKPFRAAGGER
jgi:hypothetical protein